MNNAARNVLIAFADDEHFMGQQHAEWIGVAPFLEEDLAFSSIAQDELGHALVLYEQILIGDGVEPTDQAIDALAFHRPSAQYLSCAFVEYVTTDWAEALVRHWIYDCAEELRWGLLAAPTIPDMAGLAARALHEEQFHRRHANALLDALLVVVDARQRLLAALDTLWPLVPTLLAAPPDEHQAVADGFLHAPLESLTQTIEALVNERFGVALELGSVDRTARLERSAHFEPLIARMREVFDFDPHATW